MKRAISFSQTMVADLPWLSKLESRLENRRWIIPYSLDQHYEFMESADNYHFTIFSSNEPMGFFMLSTTSLEHRSFELKRIVIDNKGQKIGRLSVQWIKRFCFEELAAHRIWLDVFIENEMALNLYLSEGFIREGVIRSCIFDEGVWRSLYQLSILEDEYKNYLINKSHAIGK